MELPAYKTIFPKALIEALADEPFCLLDGEIHHFPRDECLSCPGYFYCNSWMASYLVALSKLEKEVAVNV